MHRIAISCFQTRISKVVLLALATALMFPAISKAQVSWNMSALSTAPKVYPADDFKETGVRSLFFEGLPWKGKPTRVFAWYGVPAHAANEKVPAIVLVHGGAGTAFADWVRLWNARGYAAIAMDTCGSVPIHEGQRGWKHHDQGGPPCAGQLNQGELAD